MITLPSWFSSVVMCGLWLGEEVGEEDADSVPCPLLAQVLPKKGETAVDHSRQGLTN